MARRNGGDNFQYGVCTNTDYDGNGNPCPKCLNKEVQKIRGSKEFVCEECGESLTKVKGGDDPWWKKTIVLTAATILGILFLCAIGFGIWKFNSGPNPEDYKISIDPQEVTLKVGESIILSPAVEPADAKVTYKWESNDTEIVSVDNGGEIQALKKGETTITLSIEENNIPVSQCKVTVIEVDTIPSVPDTVFVEKIEVGDSIIVMKVADKKTLTYTTTPEKHDETISSTVSDNAIITLSQAGELEALKPGKATVTFTADKSGTKTEVEVTVKPNEDTVKPIEKINLGYGIYQGPKKGNIPHGFGGEIRIIRHYSLDLKKAPAEYVQLNPGDKIANTKFVNGQLKQGEIQFANGERRWINL